MLARFWYRGRRKTLMAKMEFAMKSNKEVKDEDKAKESRL